MNHFLLTNGRSGSNYFVGLLNQHPNVVNYGEILGDWNLSAKLFKRFFRGENASADYIDWVYRSNLMYNGAQFYSYCQRWRQGQRTHFRLRKNIKSLGVKDFYVQLKLGNAVSYFRDRPGIKIIVLLRQNTLRRYLSNIQLVKTGVAKLQEDKNDGETRLHLDTNGLIDALDVIKAENDSVMEIVSGVDSSQFIKISYEEYFDSDASHQDALIQRLMEFLDVPTMKLVTEHKRIRPKSLSGGIENYQEIAEFLCGTQYEECLHS